MDNLGKDFNFMEIKFVEWKQLIYLNKIPLSESTKNELPKHSRKLKNAKMGYYFTHYANVDISKILIDLLTLHPSNGYVQMNDCGYGSYIEVTPRGLKTGFTKNNKQINNLIMHFNDLSALYGGKVNYISKDDFLSFDNSNIKSIYYRRHKRDLSPNQNIKNYNYYTDVVILTNMGEIPFIVTDTDLYFTDKGTIRSVEGVPEKIQSIDKKKHNVIGLHDQMKDIFTFIR